MGGGVNRGKPARFGQSWCSTSARRMAHIGAVPGGLHIGRVCMKLFFCRIHKDPIHFSLRSHTFTCPTCTCPTRTSSTRSPFVRQCIIILAPVFLTNEAAFDQLPGLQFQQRNLHRLSSRTTPVVLVCLCSCACARGLVPVCTCLSCLCCRVLLLVCLCLCVFWCACARVPSARPVRPVPTDCAYSAWCGTRTGGLVGGPGAGRTLYPSVRPSVCL